MLGLSNMISPEGWLGFLDIQLTGAEPGRQWIAYICKLAVPEGSQ
jgi:hypothetical protein